jgi:hypothetical protein
VTGPLSHNCIDGSFGNVADTANDQQTGVRHVNGTTSLYWQRKTKVQQQLSQANATARLVMHSYDRLMMMDEEDADIVNDHEDDGYDDDDDAEEDATIRFQIWTWMMMIVFYVQECDIGRKTM